MSKNETSKPPVVAKNVLFTFILVTILFPLWGFANDITNPMVAAFKKILLISNTESSLVQAAFYGGYCFMAIPAALFVKKFSYKSGILVGLALYSIAALCFPVAGNAMAFWAFLLAYFVMTCGLSFLETTANPYILSLGAPETSTQRLNFAQAFNPMGSLCGMFVAMTFILANLATVNHDPQLAPLVAEQAHESISEVVFDSAEDASWRKLIDPEKEIKTDDQAKLKQLMDNGLDSWLGGDVKKAVGDEKSVDWTAALTSMKSGHERIAKVLGVISSTDTTDEAKWKTITDQNISGTLRDQDVAKIESYIKSGKEVNWELSPVLDGSPNEEQARKMVSQIDKDKWAEIQRADLDVLQGPYFAIGIVVGLFFFVVLFSKLPESESEDDDGSMNVGGTLGRLFKNPVYVGGVIAQAFYVGAQIMIWTFIIQYAGNELEIRASTAQGYNIVAMVIFVCSRFICTFLLKYVSPGALLSVLAVLGGLLVAGTIFLQGMTGLYCLIGVSACMSLMFPTIYGLALEGLGDDAKLGAAGLIMAIGGGCLMPPLQASIMDGEAVKFGSQLLSPTRASFVLPLICFAVIAVYGLFAFVVGMRRKKAAVSAS